MNSPSSIETAKKDDRIIIFDTTLRDGEQSPGASMNQEEKVLMARMLQELGVDVIEAGFPISSPGDFESVQAVSQAIDGPIIAALARCREADIESAVRAISAAKRGRVHLFLATSAIHLDFKLKMTQAQAIEKAVESIKMAKHSVNDIEFSPEDAARTENEFLRDVVIAAIEAGATTINIPDTVGYTMPDEYARKIRYLRENVPGIDKVVISVHCHDDLGMAVANSLAGMSAGARQIECTINGIGERAGNAALEEIVMALKVRNDLYHAVTGINTRLLVPASRLLTRITGLKPQRNKAIVGRNPYAHEAGIHQDGMLKDRRTYEIMRPEDVGAVQSDLVLGKHSGRSALKDCLVKYGIGPDETTLARISADFTALCDKKKEVTEADLLTIADAASSETAHTAAIFEIVEVTSSSSNKSTPTATIRLKIRENANEREDVLSSTGDGQVDAILSAMGKMTNIDAKLVDFGIDMISVGRDSQGQAWVTLEHEGKTYKGRGAETDIVQAAARAYIEALNLIARAKKGSQTNGAKDRADSEQQWLTPDVGNVLISQYDADIARELAEHPIDVPLLISYAKGELIDNEKMGSYVSGMIARHPTWRTALSEYMNTGVISPIQVPRSQRATDEETNK